MNPWWPDHLLAVLLVLALPTYAAVEYPKLVRRVRAGEHGARLREYRLTILIQWTLVIAALGAWLGSGRSPAALGLAVPADLRSVAGAGATLFVLGFLAYQWRAITRLGEAELEPLRGQIASVAELMPRSAEEHRTFRWLALTAGVCEEVLYRGFLIAYLASYAGLWPGALLAGVIFGVAHFYQGLPGVIKTGTVGLLAALLYVGTSSLLWPMIAHVAIDLQGGAAARRALRGQAAA